MKEKKMVVKSIELSRKAKAPVFQIKLENEATKEEFMVLCPVATVKQVIQMASMFAGGQFRI